MSIRSTAHSNKDSVSVATERDRVGYVLEGPYGLGTVDGMNLWLRNHSRLGWQYKWSAGDAKDITAQWRFLPFMIGLALREYCSRGRTKIQG